MKSITWNKACRDRVEDRSSLLHRKLFSDEDKRGFRGLFYAFGSFLASFPWQVPEWLPRRRRVNSRQSRESATLSTSSLETRQPGDTAAWRVSSQGESAACRLEKIPDMNASNCTHIFLLIFK